jgi:hypothetical protein
MGSSIIWARSSSVRLKKTAMKGIKFYKCASSRSFEQTHTNEPMVTNISSDLTKYRFAESKLSLLLSEFLLSVTRHFIKASASSC